MIKKTTFYFFIFILIVINIFFFFDLYINRKPDLSISTVSYNNNKNKWIVQTRCNKKLNTDKKAEVKFIFNDDTVLQRTWPLNQKKMVFELNKKTDLENVIINPPENMDWDPDNNKYYNQSIWGPKMKITEFSSNVDFDIEITENNIYLLYSDNKQKADGNSSIYLEKFKLNGEKSGRSREIFKNNKLAAHKPFLEFKKKDEAYASWKIISDELSDKIINIKFTDNQIKQTPVINNKGIEKYFACDYNKENEKLYLLTGLKNNKKYNFRLITINNTGILEKIDIKPGQDINKNIKTAEIIADKNMINIFWLKKGVDNTLLYLTKIDKSGNLITPCKMIDKIDVDFLRFKPFQIVKNNNQFHIAWIETSGGMRVTQKINYMIIDNRGNLLKKLPQFVETGGFNPGFFLTTTDKKNMELYYTRLDGKENTNIYKMKFTPDFNIIQSPQLIISDYGYEEYPYLIKRPEGNFLFWSNDKKDNSELYYATTSKKIQQSLKINQLAKWTHRILNSLSENVMAITFSLIFVIMFSIFALITLILFNKFGKYNKTQYLYWITGILLIFPVKIFNEKFYFSWENPLFSRIYSVHLINMAIVFATVSIYWYLGGKYNHQYRHEVVNKILAGWILIDSLIIAYLFVAPAFI